MWKFDFRTHYSSKGRKTRREEVEEFLDSLSRKAAQKVTWVLQLIEELDAIPEQYLKKLTATSGNAEFNSEEIPSESCAFLMDLKLRLFMDFGRKPARPQELRSREQNAIGSTFCRGGKNERFAEVSRKSKNE